MTGSRQLVLVGPGSVNPMCSSGPRSLARAGQRRRRTSRACPPRAAATGSTPLPVYERYECAVDSDEEPRASVDIWVDVLALGQHGDSPIAVVVDVAEAGGKQRRRRVDQPDDCQVPRLTIP